MMKSCTYICRNVCPLGLVSNYLTLVSIFFYGKIENINSTMNGFYFTAILKESFLIFEYLLMSQLRSNSLVDSLALLKKNPERKQQKKIFINI